MKDNSIKWVTMLAKSEMHIDTLVKGWFTISCTRRGNRTRFYSMRRDASKPIGKINFRS